MKYLRDSMIIGALETKSDKIDNWVKKTGMKMTRRASTEGLCLRNRGDYKMGSVHLMPK